MRDKKKCPSPCPRSVQVKIMVQKGCPQAARLCSPHKVASKWSKLQPVPPAPHRVVSSALKDLLVLSTWVTEADTARRCQNQLQRGLAWTPSCSQVPSVFTTGPLPALPPCSPPALILGKDPATAHWSTMPCSGQLGHWDFVLSIKYFTFPAVGVSPWRGLLGPRASFPPWVCFGCWQWSFICPEDDTLRTLQRRGAGVGGEDGALDSAFSAFLLHSPWLTPLVSVSSSLLSEGWLMG